MVSEFTDAAPFDRGEGAEANAPRRYDPAARRPKLPQARGGRFPSRMTLATALDGVSEAVVITDHGGVVCSLHGTARELLPQLAPGTSITSFLNFTSSAGTAPETGGEVYTTVRGAEGTMLATRVLHLRDGMVWYLSPIQPERSSDAAHLEFLNEATRNLSASLHAERAAYLAARLPVPRMARACCYFALSGEGNIDWTCVNAIPGAHPYGVRVTSGRWDATTVANTGWLWDLIDGWQDRINLGPDNSGTEVAEILRAFSGVPGPALALPARGMNDVLGALLFVRDTGEPSFTGAEMGALTEYAERVGTSISMANLYQQQSRIAETLRSALVPAPLPELERFALGSAYRSARQTDRIGGDYYEVVEGENGIDFLFGDVSGKGIDAAVLTGRVSQSVTALRLLEQRPPRLLELLNDIMLRTRPEKFTTMIIGRAVTCDGGGIQVEAATGGHPPPLLLHADGTVEEVELAGMFVGAIEDARFGNARFTVRPEELLLLYSDGVTEARNECLDGEMFGEERLARLLADCVGMPAAAVAERIDQVIHEWVGDGQHDDVAILALQPKMAGQPRPVF